jgi:hypothetical protein
LRTGLPGWQLYGLRCTGADLELASQFEIRCSCTKLLLGRALVWWSPLIGLLGLWSLSALQILYRRKYVPPYGGSLHRALARQALQLCPGLCLGALPVPGYQPFGGPVGNLAAHRCPNARDGRGRDLTTVIIACQVAILKRPASLAIREAPPGWPKAPHQGVGEGGRCLCTAPSCQPGNCRRLPGRACQSHHRRLPMPTRFGQARQVKDWLLRVAGGEGSPGGAHSPSNTTVICLETMLLQPINYLFSPHTLKLAILALLQS